MLLGNAEECSLCNTVHKNQLCLAAQYRLADFYLRERNKSRQWSHVMLQTGRRFKSTKGIMGY